MPRRAARPGADMSTAQYTGTPIKVRGKKAAFDPSSRSPIHKSANSSKNAAKHVADMLTPGPGNALAGQLEHRSRSRPTKAHRYKTHISALENLPNEILQLIFFFCLEANFDLGLLRASPLIGAKLSDSYVYNVYCRLAFTHVRDSAGVIYSINGVSYLFDLDLIKGRDQSLRCRWMTWPYFQTLSDQLQLQGQRHLERLKYLTATEVEEKCTNNWPRVALRHSHIPVKLLKLPFQSGQVGFLSALVAAGAKIDSFGSVAAEYAEDLLLHAVKNKQHNVISILLDYRTIDWFPSADALQRVMEAMQYSKDVAWMLHEADKCRRFHPHHGRCCSESFPCTNAKVMAGLSHCYGSDIPMCWDESKRHFARCPVLPGGTYITVRENSD